MTRNEPNADTRPDAQRPTSSSATGTAGVDGAETAAVGGGSRTGGERP